MSVEEPQIEAMDVEGSNEESPQPRDQREMADPKEEDLAVPDPAEEEHEDQAPLGPTPSTPKMTESWEAVPRKILQPFVSPVRKEAPKASDPLQTKKGKVKKGSRLCGTNRALVDGVWQTDASAHMHGKGPNRGGGASGTTNVEPGPGMATLRVAYFFSGVERKSSIADCLREDCTKSGMVSRCTMWIRWSAGTTTICHVLRCKRRGSKGLRRDNLTC